MTLPYHMNIILLYPCQLDTHEICQTIDPPASCRPLSFRFFFSHCSHFLKLFMHLYDVVQIVGRHEADVAPQYRPVLIMLTKKFQTCAFILVLQVVFRSILPLLTTLTYCPTRELLSPSKITLPFIFSSIQSRFHNQPHISCQQKTLTRQSTLPKPSKVSNSIP